MKVFAKNVMQRNVKTVSPNLSIQDLEGRFVEDHVSGFPVVDGQTLIGVVSASDILRFHHAQQSKPDTPNKSTARDVMSDKVVSVPPNISLHDAAALMHEKDIHRLFVLDGSKLVGVLSAHDIVRACADERVDISFAPPEILDF